jgi:hypothetical protein
MELVNPALDNDLGGSWRSSGYADGQAGPTNGLPIDVANYSFEESQTAKTWNWSDQEGSGVNVIDGWHLDYSGSSADTGVEDNSLHPSSDGTWHAFVRSGYTSGPWQDLGETIQPGVTYLFYLDARWEGNTCELKFNYHDGGGRTAIAVTNIAAGSSYETCSLAFTAAGGEPYIGKSLGIEFNNTGSGWLSCDNARVVKLLPGTDFFDAQENWHYRKGTSEPSSPMSAWRQLDFTEDSSWQAGQASIGYGESFIVTELSDMRNNYTTVYFRKFFTVADPGMYASLSLQAQYDDGINVWINGRHVARENVLSNDMPYTGTAIDGYGDDYSYRPFILTGVSEYLQPGTNVIAVQLFNISLGGSSDAFFDALLVPTADPAFTPTPGQRNSVYAVYAPPQARQVQHTPDMPAAGRVVTVTAKITDPDGVASVMLHYQAVEPGSYIRIIDTAYENGWSGIAMHDDGLDGDETAGDAIYTVQLPGPLQQHRRLVRYRITAEDTLGMQVRVPYTDDPEPNFAYFCYNGIPGWRGALRPGITSVLEFDTNVMQSLQAYHLVADETDVINCQYNSAYNEQYFYGTLVYDGEVYDHMRYRIKGEYSTYFMGKNKWKFNFHPTHRLKMRDNYGRRYRVKWDKVNISTGACPWWYFDRSTDGVIMNEAAAFAFFRLAGVPACHSTYVQLRVVDDSLEADQTDQFEGDFWGMYIAIEETDGQFLDARDLPDGNLYNMHGSVGGSVQKNQGATQVSDRSDLSWFISSSTGYNKTGPIQPLSWWRTYVDLDAYYRYNAVHNAVNNSDQRPESNCVYYHNTNGQWTMIPWDLDLTFESTNHFYPVPEHFQYVLQHDEGLIEYKNRVRELKDLLINSGQGGQLIEEHARILTREGSPGRTFPEANQAMWDYHPRKYARGKQGLFYANTPQLAARNFPSLVAYMKTFFTPGGYGGQLLSGKDSDADIPYTPTVIYDGPDGFPSDRLVFICNAFDDPQGSHTFAGMQWRLAEITDTNSPLFDPDTPRKYEINAVWDSGEMPVFVSSNAVPAGIAQRGHAYRVRVRFKDTSGRWSHWSDPVEFTVSGSPAGEHLRVTELMYHPPDGEEYEFIELYNTGLNTLDISDVVFTDGVYFSFAYDSSIHELRPTNYLVLVNNLAVFSTRYDTNSMVIAGEYQARLANSGEQLSLVRTNGEDILTFTYSDTWYPETDGGGYSLVISDPYGEPLLWNLKDGWQPSTLPGGSPGREDIPEPACVFCAGIFFLLLSRVVRMFDT